MDPRDPDYIELVIKRLEKLEGPSTIIDGQVAVIMGFQKKSGPGGKPLWLAPSSNIWSDQTPHYTGDFDAIFGVIRYIWPDSIGAVTWDPNRPLRGKAQFWDQPAVEAATPEIALLIATLRLKLRMDQGYAPE